MPQTRRSRPKNRHTRLHRKQSGGAEHIYTIPLKSLFHVVYDLGLQLSDLRSKCATMCLEKLCKSPDPVACTQAQGVVKTDNVTAYAGALCNGQLVRIPTGNATCQATPAPAICVCDQLVRKYRELHHLMSELDEFLSNYHVDNPIKQYIIKVREAGHTILAVMDNFNMDTHLKRVPEEQRSKSINDIMQTTEFKNALRKVMSPPRPVTPPASAPPANAPPANAPPASAPPASAPPASAPPVVPARSRLLAAKTSASRHLIAPAPAPAPAQAQAPAPALIESTRLLNDLRHMNAE